MSSTEFRLAACVADMVGEVIDGVSALSRFESAISASRAIFIEEARRLTVVQEGVSAVKGAAAGGAAESRSSVWKAEMAAHRILVSELSCALNLAESAVDTLISDSQLIVNELHLTLAALQRGEISWRHAHVMADHAASLPPESRATFEQRVLPYALTHTVSRFNRHARIQRERTHPESIDERHETALEKRSVDLQPGSDGMAWLTAHLPAPTAHAIFDRLTDAAQQASHSEDERTVGQLRADAFAAALLGCGSGSGFGFGLVGATPSESSLNASVIPTAPVTPPAPTASVAPPDLCAILGAIRPTVHLTVPALTLLGRGDEPAILDGYGPIDLETASRLTANAPNFLRLLTHPETGAVLSVGRDRYQIPADLRRWLQIRDGTCRFPGCGRAARRCDLDHTTEWQHGGATADNNLAHLCRKHHRLKSLTDWTLEQIGDGALRWTSPLGRVYVTEPEEVIATRRARDGTKRAA